jgi:hypothetical protein
LGAWGPGGCGSVELRQVVRAEYEWRAEGKIFRLYYNGQPTNRTAPRCDCGCKCNSQCDCNAINGPCNSDCKCVPQEANASNNHGLIVDKLLNGDKPEAFYYGDREISADEVPDVFAKPYLTIISGDKAKRQQVLAEILRTDFAKKFQIQARHPKDWQLALHKLDQDERFKKTNFLILVQSPPGQNGWGKVQHAFYSYDLETLRKIDPTYDPNRNPDGKPATPTSLTIPKDVLVLLGLGILAVLFLRRRS